MAGNNEWLVTPRAPRKEKINAFKIRPGSSKVEGNIEARHCSRLNSLLHAAAV